MHTVDSVAGAPAVAPGADTRRWHVLAVVVAAQFVFVVDAFIVNVAIPSIQADLGATGGEMDAVIAAYQIAYAAMVITGGRLGDIFGRRPVFIAGVLGFAAASLWCGLSGSGMALVFARLAQGGTAALMVPQVLATIHTLFPDAARTRAFAVFGMVLGLGGAVGFALGGWLVTLDVAGLGWRAVFLVNLPVCAVIAVAAARLMPHPASRPEVRLDHDRLRLTPSWSATRCFKSVIHAFWPPASGDHGLDIPGAVLLFLALSALISPVMVGRDIGWPIWLWAIMADGAVMLALFLRLERAVARRGGMPLIDLALLDDAAFIRGLAAVFAFQFGNIAFYLLITLFMQGQLGFTPLRAGLAVVPLALAFAVAARLAGRWVVRHGVSTLLLGCAIQFCGIVILGAVVALLNAPGIVVIMVVLAGFGFGQGLVMAPLSGLVLTTVRPAHAGSGAGLLNTVQQAAGATGVSLVGTLAFQGNILAGLVLLACAILATAGLLIGLRPKIG